MQRDIEEDKKRQKELYNEEKLKHQQEMMQKRYEDEQRREMPIDYGLVAKNREKFEKVFLKSGKSVAEKPSAQGDRQADERGSIDKTPQDNLPDNDIGVDSKIEDVFDAEVIFRRQKPAYSVENSRQEKPNYETSFASNDYDAPQSKQKRNENHNEYKDSLDDIKRQQQRNILNQMGVENEYRPQVIGNAPIQGYGLNRNRQTSYEALVQHEHQNDMHGALDRYEQAKREHYRGLNKEEIMPFLPTTKQIIENQAVRDVKGEMILMRGHILSNFQKMRSDMDRIREDVAKSDTRFKYANAEYQDSLKREMSMRDNQMIDVLDHIRQWNPNQVVHPQDQQYSHKHLAKVPDFYIPQLNFESMTNELRQKLEELKNPHVFRNTAARKLDEYQSQTKFMVEPKTYIRAEELRAGSVFVNPNSKYLDEVIEEDRHQERLQRATRVREMEEAKRKGTKFSNHSSEGNQLNPNDEHKAAAGRLEPTKSHQPQKENSLAKDKEPSKASTAKVDIKKTPPQKIEESGEEEEQDNGSQQIGHLEGEEESQVDDSIADAIGDVNNKKDGVKKGKVEKDDEEGEEESDDLIEDEEGGLLDDDELDGYEESEVIEDKKGNKKDSKPSKNDDEF